MSTYEMDQHKRIFAENLRRYLEKAEKSQTDLQRYMGVSSSTVSDWIRGMKMPRMDKIQSICNWLGIQKSDLLEEKSFDSPEEGYYTNPETARIAQEVFDDPELHVLFDAAKDASPEDIRKAADYLLLAKQMTVNPNQNDEGC